MAPRPRGSRLTGIDLGGSGVPAGLSADAPAFFNKLHFRTRHIEQVLRREESGGARDLSGTMLLRIDRLLADRLTVACAGRCISAIRQAHPE